MTGTATVPGAQTEALFDELLGSFGIFALTDSFSDAVITVDIPTGNVGTTQTGEAQGSVSGPFERHLATEGPWSSSAAPGGEFTGTMPGYNFGATTYEFCTENWPPGGCFNGTPSITLDADSGRMVVLGALTLGGTPYYDLSGDQYWTEAPRACPDIDGDTVCDGADNCPYFYNPGQQPSDLTGVGADCRCADVDDDGDFDAADPQRLREWLAGLATLGLPGVGKCGVIGGPDACGLVTVVAFRRALAAEPEPPILQSCKRALLQ